MARKRPCRVCRRWFWPHPRAGDRQHTCSRPDCQRERHRRACAAWRLRHPDYDREDRLRRRLREAFRRNRSAFEGWDLVVNIRESAVRRSSAEIEAELLDLARRARRAAGRRAREGQS